MKRTISMILAVMMLLSTFAGMTFTADAAGKNGWVKQTEYYEDGSYTAWYYYENGKAVTGWKQIKGVWYYFEKSWDGEMVSDCTYQIGKQVYYFAPSGAMKANGWVQDSGGSWYYASKNGALAKGWKQIKGTWYYFDKSGCYMYVGVYKVGKKIELFGSSGAWVEKPKNGWNSTAIKYYEDGKTYTYKEWCYYKNGSFFTGWHKLGGKWYFFDKINGNMYSGVFNDGKKWYYAYESGALREKAGWASIKTYWAGAGEYVEWYYSNSDGSLVTGWKTIKGVKYYFDTVDAYMYSDGVYEIDGKYYDFDKNGKCLGEVNDYFD